MRLSSVADQTQKQMSKTNTEMNEDRADSMSVCLSSCACVLSTAFDVRCKGMQPFEITPE